MMGKMKVMFQTTNQLASKCWIYTTNLLGFFDKTPCLSTIKTNGFLDTFSINMWIWGFL